ncbi:MAG TPA: hypothetical protein VE987_18455 [Polyangiaceae bacterium]|nr:hypothetical protein [Polyangiaceae bacterium]
MTWARGAGAARASLCVAALVAALSRCSPRVVDAVDLRAQDDGGATADAGAGLVWPNETSTKNSDPWIAAHHDDIVEMHPRLIVLDFYDGTGAARPFDVSNVQDIAQQQIDAIAEGSRYHGYSDPSAPAFLNYELVKVVDLTDHPAPAGWTHASSTLLPVDSSGAFDLSALFSADFAHNYGEPDPADPSRDLALCDLFERGIINELWLAVADAPPRQPGLFVESKQVYDDQNRPVAQSFASCTGYACYPGPPVPRCNVTVRIAHLDPRFELGCDLIVRSIGIENMRLAIPYMQKNALDFIDHDFDSRFGVPFASWEDLCDTSTAQQQPPATAQPGCVEYPSPSVAQGTYADGGAWTIAPFVQGCGSAHFPANARFKWDYVNTQPVQSRCEHYGMHDGPDGGDLPDLYRADKVTAYTQRYGDPDAGGSGGCGGGWQVYYRQNMPGLNNRAHAADGSPMKNWWPFLFY